MEMHFSIDSLRRYVAGALQGGGYTPAASARVRDVPDTRAIRYYTTLGLIDRPASMEGRTALYGKRHVMQLVAIKRLQATGLTLAEVQSRLTGLPNAALSKIAKLPTNFWDASPIDSTSEEGVSPDEERPFWSELPSEAVESNKNVRRSIRVELHPGVELLVDVADAGAKPVDLERIQIAAAHLLKELARQRLIDAGQ